MTLVSRERKEICNEIETVSQMEYRVDYCMVVFDATDQLLSGQFFGYVWYTYRYAIYLFCSGLSWMRVVWTDTKNKTRDVIHMDSYYLNCQ